MFLDVWSLFAPQATGHAFQAIHQTRNGHLRRIFHQQVNMIISAVHADQGGLEVGTDLGKDSLVARIGMETEFSLSQAVASGDAFEHRPSERGHCVQDFLAELNLRDLPGEA